MTVFYKYILLFVVVMSSCGQYQVIQNSNSAAHIKDTDIFVSPQGDDMQSGKINAPLKTVSAAIKIIEPNATVYLRKGLYSETVLIHTSKKNIRIQAYNNETPVITGNEIVGNWKQFKGNIYYAEIAQVVTQLFIDKEQMSLAKWPNQVSKNPFEYKYANGNIAYKSHERTSLLIDENLKELENTKLKGAKIWLPYPLKSTWNSFTETVVNLHDNSLAFTSVGYFNKGGNDSVINQQSRKIKSESNGQYEEIAPNVNYYLTGALALLDAEREWYYDVTSKRLYFMAPEGQHPSKYNVLARTRLEGVVIKGSNVVLNGIDFFAATATIKGNNNTIENCNFLYPRPYYLTAKFKEQSGVSIQGNFNTIKKCEVAYSWGTGISMLKSKDGRIEDCLVHDVNWSGSVAPGISVDGTRITVKNNTVYACGRSGIRHYRVYSSIFTKNHIYRYGLINHDLGAIKGGLQDYKNSVWSYNYCHDTDVNIAKAGIYLDASNDNATVHHNVMYNVHLAINGNVTNDSVYNNTLVADNAKQKTWSHFIRKGNNWDYKSVYTWNNFSTNSVKGTEIKHNLKIRFIEDMGFVGYEYGDFRLKSNSPAINYGSLFENENNEKIKVDAGAYAYNKQLENGNWIPGITWSPKWNKVPVAEFEWKKQIEDSKEISFKITNASDSEGWILRYDWDFGDGETAFGKEVTHTYAKNGKYQVALKIQDNLRGVSIIEKQIELKK